MRKLRKMTVLSMALAVGLSLCACSGNRIEDTKEVPDVSYEEAEASEEINGEDNMPLEEGDILYVYSWNEEVGDRLQYFRELYPQYADRVEYVNLEVGANSGDYTAFMETLMQGKYEKAEKYPSIVAFDASVVLDYVQSDYTLPMSELGIEGDDVSNMYEYTLDYVTYEDEVKALTWQVTPGVVCYRKDIAEIVLGAGDPETVQEALGDWDSFFETAEKVKEAGYKMVSGSDDIRYPFMDSKKLPWVENEELNIDTWVTQYLEAAKKLYDGEYTNQTTVESEEWHANMDKDVFCYFGNPSFFYWELNPETHMGDYAVCEGPAAFHWGGTYLTVARDCQDKALAALILRTLCCDTEVMTKIGEETSDVVNNKDSVAALIESGEGASDKIGGDDPLPVFHSVAEKVDVSHSTVYDTKFDGFVDRASAEYNAGNVESAEDAIELIKDWVTEGYNYIKVE